MTVGKSYGNNLEFALDSTSGGSLTYIGDWVMSVDGLPGEREMADVTCGGGSNSHAYLAGMQNGEITLQCLFDQTTDSAYDTLSGFMDDTGSRTFVFFPATTASGAPKMTGECRVKNVVLPAKPLEPLTFSATLVLDSTITVTTV